MKNIFTQNTEGLEISYSQEKSVIDYPVNEDRAIVVEVTGINGNIIEGKKIWDEAPTPKTLYAKKIGDGVPEIGSYMIFHRVGDYNSPGESGYELHIEDATKVSFVCFIGAAKVTFVRIDMAIFDMAWGTEVIFDNFGTPTPVGLSLDCYPSDSWDQFHNGNPPWEMGRIFFAERIEDAFIIWLPGFGSYEKTIQAQSGTGVKCEIDIDAQGNVLDFRAEQATVMTIYDENKWFFSQNYNHGNGCSSHIYLNNRTPGADVDNTEVLLYAGTDYSTYIGKTRRSRYRTDTTYQEPILWNAQAWNNNNLRPWDYYEDAIGQECVFIYSPDKPANFLERPGSAVYPPPGQVYQASSLFCVEVIEYLSAGGTNVSVRDDSKNVQYYQEVSPITYYKFAYCPCLSTAIGANNTGLGALQQFRVFVPADHALGAFWKLSSFVGYCYVPSGPNFTCPLLAYKSIGVWNDYGAGSVKFPAKKSDWGIPLGTTCSYVMVVQTFTVGAITYEMWYPPAATAALFINA